MDGGYPPNHCRPLGCPSSPPAPATARHGDYPRPGGRTVGQQQQRQRAMDMGTRSIAVAATAGAAVWDARAKAGGLITRGLLAASVGVMANLAVGVWVSTTDCCHAGLVGFLNLCASFVPAMVAMGEGGEFRPEIAHNMYRAVRSLFD